MTMINKIKKNSKLSLLGLNIFNSYSMNDKNNKVNIKIEKINENHFNNFKNEENKLFQNIKNLKEEFKINKIYCTNYNEELKNIVDTLNNLKYSHNHKFYKEEGIEELKNIYYILCQNILKLATYLYYIDDKNIILSNEDILEKVLKPLIEREKIIAKNNHFETDFVYDDFLCQYIHLKVTNLLYDFYKDVNESYHKCFENVTDFLFDFIEGDKFEKNENNEFVDVSEESKERFNKLITRVKNINNFSENANNYLKYSPQSKSVGGYNKCIYDKKKDICFFYNIIGTKHRNLNIQNNCGNDVNKFISKKQTNNKYYNEILYDNILEFIKICSHEYIHNIEIKTKKINAIVNKYAENNNEFLKIDDLSDDIKKIAKNNKYKINKIINNSTRYREYKENLKKFTDSFFIIKNDNDQVNLFSRDYMHKIGEFFTVNMEFFIGRDHEFNTYTLYILNNEINKVIRNYKEYKYFIHEKMNKINNENNINNSNININNQNENYEIYKNKNCEVYLYNNKNIFKTDFINKLKNCNFTYIKEYNIIKSDSKIIKEIINEDFLKKFINYYEKLKLFISVNFDTSKYLEDYLKNGYKFKINHNKKNYYIISNKINFVKTIFYPENISFGKGYYQSYYTSIFNKNIKKSLTLETFGDFDNLNNRDFSYLFSGCKYCKIDLSDCNFNNVYNLESMFENCKNLQDIVLPKYEIYCENIKNMFSNCIKLKSIDFNFFFIKNIKKMDGLFCNCKSIEKIEKINNLDTENVEDMSYMFFNCENLKLSHLFNLEFQKMNFSSINSMYSTFFNCLNIENIRFPEFNSEKNINFSNTFKNCENLQYIFLGKNKINTINTKHTFYNCKKLYFDFFDKFNTENVEDMSYMFFNCHNLKSCNIKINAKNCKDMSGIFANCKNMTFKDGNFPFINTKNVVDMSYMFANNRSLNNISNLYLLDTSNCKNMEGMFCGCERLKNIYLSRYDNNNCKFNTSNVENMENMFSDCKSLKNLDLSFFDTINVKNMRSMFRNCSSLEKINIFDFIFQNVEDMSYMFYNCKNLREFEISNDFETLNLKYAQCMFYNCINLTNLYLKSFTLKNVENISKMFFNCENLRILDMLIENNIELLQYKNLIFYRCIKLNQKYITINDDNFIKNQLLDLQILFPKNNKTEDKK